MEENFCLQILNRHGKGVTESDKQQFIAELRTLHVNGYYICPVKDGGMKISNKKPESLAKQIACFDELIEATFERVQ